MLRLLYWLYAFRLRRQIGSHPVPRHVGIVLDGNRRYARKHRLSHPRAAYDLGAEKLDDVLAWCFDLGIPAVTLWVCSIDNLRRSKAEVSDILAAVEAKIGALAQDSAIHCRRVRVQAVGRLDLLPSSTRTVLRAAERATADYDALILTIAIAYGGREEIADAVRDLVRDKVRHGADLEASLKASRLWRSTTTSTRWGYPTSTSSSAQAARSVCPASCSGRALTASFISPMSTGQSFAESIFSAPSDRFNSVRGASGDEPREWPQMRRSAPRCNAI
jgi:undecaprenyl diphosphate synthase